MNEYGNTMFTRPATLRQFIAILVFVMVAFLICGTSKVLVGWLIIVPFIFLLAGIPLVLRLWIDRIRNWRCTNHPSPAEQGNEG